MNAVEGVDIPEEQLRSSLAHMHDVMRYLWVKAVDAQVKRAAKNRRGRKAEIIPRISVGDLVLVAEAYDKWQAWHEMDGTSRGAVLYITFRIHDQARTSGG